MRKWWALKESIVSYWFQWIGKCYMRKWWAAKKRTISNINYIRFFWKNCFFKHWTIIKSAESNHFNRRRDFNSLQWCALAENIVAEWFQWIWKRNFAQRIASVESVVANWQQWRWERHFCERSAAFKCAFFYRCDWFWYWNFGQWKAAFESIISDSFNVY